MKPDNRGWIRSLIYFALLSLVVCAWSDASAENTRRDGVVFSRSGFPAPGASIAVCTQPAATSAVPCSPLAPLCASATDTACTSPNPITADELGNYNFYIRPGKYTIQFYGSGLTPRVQPDQILSCDPTSCAAQRLNGIRFADQFAGSDMGVRIQAAIADLPSTGGVVDARGFSGAQTWSTDVFGSTTKPVTLLLNPSVSISVSTIQHILTNNIEIAGAAVNPNYGGAPQAAQTAGSRFTYTGSATSSGMFNIGNATTPILGFRLSNAHFNCNSLAASAIVADRMQGSTWSGAVTAEECTGTSFIFTNDGTATDGGTSWNNIAYLASYGSPSCVQFSGNSYAAAYVNHFGMVQCDFTSGGNGLDFYDSDSNVIEQFYGYRNSGAGKGIYFHETGVYSRSNYIKFADPSGGGIYQEAYTSPNSPNFIGLVMTENWAGSCTAPCGSVVQGSGNIIWTDSLAHIQGAAGGTYGWTVQIGTPATARANRNSPSYSTVCGNYWNGSASTQLCATQDLSIAAGTTPLAKVNYDIPNAPSTKVHYFSGNLQVTGSSSLTEGSAPFGGASGIDVCYADSTAHVIKCSYNNGSFLEVPRVIASGTSALGIGAISATSCTTAVTTAATGTATTDAIEWSFNAAPGAGYTRGLVVSAYVTSGNVNFLVCNPTAGSLTPAAGTVNWRVIR